MAKIFTDPSYADTHAIRTDPVQLAFDARHLQALDAGANLYEVKEAVRTRKLQLVDGAESSLKLLRPGGTVDSYYLPYRENHTTRILLDPAGKQISPRFFVTDELSGCMVAVYGPPATPTVYHLNAQAFGGNLANVEPQDFSGLVIRKAAEMKRRATDANRRFPIDPRRATGGRTISLKDYLECQTKPAVAAQVLAKAQRALHINPRDYPEFDDFKPAEPLLEAFGFVFGIKDDRKGWAFYVQSRVRIRGYIRANGTDGQQPDQWDVDYEHPKHLVLWSKKFYPDGIGDAI